MTSLSVGAYPEMYNIFFPIETMARELDYRLLLAAKVLKKNRRVYICEHRHLSRNIHRFRGGIYVGKHILPRLNLTETWEEYNEVKQLGIDVIYINEEGAIFKGTPEDWEHTLALQYDPRKFDRSDRLLVWGTWQQAVHEKQNLEVPVIATGHPRLDLCKQKYSAYYRTQTKELKDRFGDYILVNGNYASANHGIGLHLLFSPSQGYDVNDPAKRQNFVDFYAHCTKSMMDMICLVHRLATAFPEKNIIYRSHPSEGDTLYQNVFSGLDNVKLIHDGPIGPWLLAAGTVLHDGCTTAIEASFSSAQIINYKLNEDKQNDIRLPNLVGIRAKAPEEVIELIRQSTVQPIHGTALDELGAMMANYDEDSFDNIARVIDEKIGTSDAEAGKFPSERVLKQAYQRLAFKKKKRKLLSRKKRKAVQYQEKKFPGFELNRIEKQLNDAADVMQTKVKLAYLDPYMMVLESGE